MIGEEVEVQICRFRFNDNGEACGVVLGINAPDSVIILRKELVQSVRDSGVTRIPPKVQLKELIQKIVSDRNLCHLDAKTIAAVYAAKSLMGG